MKLVVGISGASGVNLGLKFLKALPKEIETYAIVSKAAKKTLMLEEKIDVKSDLNGYENITLLDDNDLGECVSSGSFKVDQYIIIPCSMNTLAKCAIGMSDNLIARTFSVMLKEKRNIILAPREMPFNTIQLENMTKLSNLGVTIAPPVIGYYSAQQSLEEMENFLIGKWFDLLHIQHNLFKRWKSDEK